MWSSGNIKRWQNTMMLVVEADSRVYCCDLKSVSRQDKGEGGLMDNWGDWRMGLTPSLQTITLIWQNRCWPLITSRGGVGMGFSFEGVERGTINSNGEHDSICGCVVVCCGCKSKFPNSMGLKDSWFRPKLLLICNNLHGIYEWQLKEDGHFQPFRNPTESVSAWLITCFCWDSRLGEKKW